MTGRLVRKTDMNASLKWCVLVICQQRRFEQGRNDCPHTTDNVRFTSRWNLHIFMQMEWNGSRSQRMVNDTLSAEKVLIYYNYVC